MLQYVTNRLLHAVVVVILVSLVTFGLLHTLPGGIVRAQLGGKATQAAVHHLSVQEGLSKPFFIQYWIWLWNAAHGSLGFSYQQNQPVGTLLAEYLPRTLLLVCPSVALAMAVAVPIGLLQAARRNRIVDYSITVSMLIFYSMPGFLMAIVLIVVFGLWLNVVPITASNFGISYWVDFHVLVLPMLTLFLGNVSYYSRYMRSAAIESLLSDYVTTAKAKGASQPRVLIRHVLRNSSSVMMSLAGLTFPYVLSGSLIVETVFNYPGMGLLFWNALQDRDFTVLLGVLLVVSVVTTLGSLLADLGYACLDPRVRTR